MTPTAASAPVVAAEAGAGPNQLAFSSASTTLSPGSLKKIADIAQTATKNNNGVVISAKLEAGAGREERMDLAKKRADGVRIALQAGGVSVNVLKVQISELPVGLVPAKDADRIELTLK